MKILLTNDDGIDAPGLEALFQSVRLSFGHDPEVIVVAPDRGRSECGHSVTTGRPLVVEERRPGWFAVDGTPVDCVRVAVASLAADVDFVVSGVNAGANLGVDLLVSGTFAAAREAAIHGLPAMAVSHYRRPDVPRTWDHVPRWLANALQEFYSESQDCRGDHRLWNVNLPAIDPDSPTPSITDCEVDCQPLVRTASKNDRHIILESDFHGRPRDRGRDVELCFGGQITVSKLMARIT